MSGVARYHAETASSHPQGAFVLYEDYAALLERIAESDATIASLREAHMEMTRLCLKANDERKAADDRIAALEADAARYRWLIENSVPQQDDHGRWYWDLSLYAEGPVKAEVDHVIDAALDAARVGCKHERLQSLDCHPPHVSCMDCGETVDAARVGG